MTGAVSSRGRTARNSSGDARVMASRAIDAALGIVQARQRARARCELLDVGGKLALQEFRGLRTAECDHTEVTGSVWNGVGVGVLIFVFAGVSCGRARLILAEFAPVPNVHSVEAPAATRNSTDVRATVQVPTLALPDAKPAVPNLAVLPVPNPRDSATGKEMAAASTSRNRI